MPPYTGIKFNYYSSTEIPVTKNFFSRFEVFIHKVDGLPDDTKEKYLPKNLEKM